MWVERDPMADKLDRVREKVKNLTEWISQQMSVVDGDDSLYVSQ